MANKDDYLTFYREFFENFAQTVNPDDQLPVKPLSYKLINVEVVGAIIDWTTQYLTQKKCPTQLIAPLIKMVIEEIRKSCKKHPIDCGFNPTDNAYEPLKLMQAVTAKINEICLRYLDNSMLCSLPFTSNTHFPTSVCAVRNSRRKMEDRHVVIHDLNTMFNIQEASPSSYYAIFDGHAGFQAASYSATHLHQFLAESEYFIVNPEQALVDAFLKTDTLFIDKLKNEKFSGISSSGTTAVVALLQPKEKTLFVAWVGDSQALLVNQGRILQIVNPHKPSRDDERERIEKQGGRVLIWGIWRVDGQLAVSRAIGDAEYKPYVTALPDVREIPLDGGEDFLILACDGLWDVVTEDCAARTVYRLICEDPEDTDRISPHLVQLAKAQKSTDNISVIVVFLKEPSKIAAEALWANRNCTTSEMETKSLDNVNNPFSIPNGATNEMDNVIATQKSDGLLLNLTDNFKQNGADISPPDFFLTEKSNGKRTASEFDDDDDYGPESNVDTVDDVLSPTSKKFEENVFKDEGFEGHYNPFMEHQEKAAFETEKSTMSKEDITFEGIHKLDDDDDDNDIEELEKETKKAFTDDPKEKDEFQSEFQQQLEDAQRMAREETPTPPADTVHDVSGLVDNAAESESEDEWNYITGEVANKENIPPQPEKEVADIPEEDDSMSQLNPNAAEFVPVSPTRSAPSPLCRSLLNDEVIAQSPKRAQDIEINVPNQMDFENEVKSRPSEVDSFNGHSEDVNKSSDLIDNLLNGKNIDDIPEFQPGSTPKKNLAAEEFHFGPNAVQFTPAKLLDQSEAGLSTKALFGDESVATIGTPFNESSAQPEISLLNKESDPMSMSFYEDRGDNNLFDPNKVHLLPDNLDEFLKETDVNNSEFNETISDVPEHHPLGQPENVEKPLNNDDILQVTDLDKQSYDDEKELASPLEPEKELLGDEESEPNRTPEPTHENLLGSDFCCLPKLEKRSEDLLFANDDEVVSPDNDLESGVATEISDLLKTETVNLPPDVELIPPELSSEIRAANMTDQPRAFDEIEADLICERPVSKSPAPNLEAISPALICERPDSESPLCEKLESESPVCEKLNPESPVFEKLDSESPVCEKLDSESSICEKLDSESSICHRPEPKSELVESKLSITETLESNSQINEMLESNSPICERPESSSSVCERPDSKLSFDERPESQSSLVEVSSPVCERPESKSPICERPESMRSPICERPESKSPICERPESKSPICERPQSISPICERPQSKSSIQEPAFERPLSSSPLNERQDSESSIRERDISSPACPLPSLQTAFGVLDIPKSPIPNETQALTLDFTSSQQIEEAQTNFDELCRPQEKLDSPLEDVTSSVKDDVSPSPDQLIPQTEEFEPIEPNLVPAVDVSNSLIDTSVVATSIEDSFTKQDINNLQSSLLPELTQGEEIDVKTDKITPEFAEQAVIITPSEESKHEDISLPKLDEPSKETEVVPSGDESSVTLPEIAIVAGATAAAATVAAAAAATTPDTKVGDKKKTATPSATKKSTLRVSSAGKSTTPKSSPLSAPTPKSTGAKPSVPKSGSAKLSATSLTSKPTPATAKSIAKPKVPSALAPKTAEKKPLANGDIKSTVKSSLTAKKDTPLSKTLASKPLTSAPKLSPTTKTTIPKTTPSPKPFTTTKAAPAPKPFTARPAPSSTTRPSSTTSAPKRPTTLTTNKTTSSPANSSTVPSKASLSKTSPKALPASKSKPATTTTTAKPKTAPTKTVAKAPDAEKQNKESANKIMASKSTTGTLSSKTAVGSTRTVTSSTARKIESKTLASRTTVSKTTTTTMKSTTGKKPVEIVRNASSKPKTTKIEKPKQNGESTIVTEELTVVHTTNNSIDVDGDPQLIKDNSPLDNKLIIDSFVEPPNSMVD